MSDLHGRYGPRPMSGEDVARRVRVFIRAQRDRRVADMLEEMAPDLLRINPGAAETAARIMVRLRS